MKFHRAFFPVIFVIVAAVGTGFALFLWRDAKASEFDLSKQSFRASYTSMLETFESFITGQLRAIKAIADGVTAQKAPITPVVFDRVSPFPSATGGACDPYLVGMGAFCRCHVLLCSLVTKRSALDWSKLH